MYPYLRLFKELMKARRQPGLGILESHISQHVCWPWDIDPWMELNNGRTLTLFDLGRLPLGARTGLHRVMMARGWGMTVAGNSLRYRKRVRTFDRVEMVSRCVGWDHRFLYIEQSMWRHGECTSHMLLRGAVTSKDGIVPPAKVMEALGVSAESPELPGWIGDWIAADAGRAWPPLREAVNPRQVG